MKDTNEISQGRTEPMTTRRNRTGALVIAMMGIGLAITANRSTTQAHEAPRTPLAGTTTSAAGTSGEPNTIAVIVAGIALIGGAGDTIYGGGNPNGFVFGTAPIAIAETLVAAADATLTGGAGDTIYCGGGTICGRGNPNGFVLGTAPTTIAETFVAAAGIALSHGASDTIYGGAGGTTVTSKIDRLANVAVGTGLPTCGGTCSAVNGIRYNRTSTSTSGGNASGSAGPLIGTSPGMLIA
jgi:hypothetical protein